PRTPTPHPLTLSLHDALPILPTPNSARISRNTEPAAHTDRRAWAASFTNTALSAADIPSVRSANHTSNRSRSLPSAPLTRPHKKPTKRTRLNPSPNHISYAVL